MSEPEPPISTPTPLSDDMFLPVASVPSRRRRTWIVLAVYGAIIGVFCLAGCLTFRMFFQMEFETSPDKVLAAAKEIAEFDLPDGYEGELAETIRAPIFLVRKVVFRHSSGKGVLTFAQMAMDIGDKAEVDQAVRPQLDKMIKDMRQIAATAESKRTVTIRGEPAEFELRSGTDALSSTRIHEVRGTFRAKSGLAQLWWQAEDSIGQPAEMDRFVDTLK